MPVLWHGGSIMIIQDSQFAVYAQKQPNTNVKQVEQAVNTASENGRQNSDFRSRFEEKAVSLSISEKADAKVFEIRQAVGDLKGSNTKTQIAGSAFSQVQGLVYRANALTIQALNDTDQSNIEKRIENLKEEIDRISRMEKKGTEEDVQASEERILSQPAQAVAVQANQTAERVLGLLA